MINRKDNHLYYILSYFFLIQLSFVLVILSVNFLFPFSGDYFNYISEFITGGTGRFELGYRTVTSIYTLIVSRTESSFLYLWVLFAFFSINIKIYAAYLINKKTIFSFFICYVIYAFLLHETNQIRASLGLSFSLLSMYYIFNNSNKKGFVLIVLGCLFHSSMCLFLSVFVVKYFIDRSLYKLFVILTSLLSLFIYIVFDPNLLGGINPLMMVYSSASLDYSFNLYYLLVLTAILFFGMLVFNSISKLSQSLCFFYLLLFLLAISLSTFPIIAVRVMDIATVVAIYFVHSVTLKMKFSIRNIMVINLYIFIYVLCVSRSYIFFTTDTIYRFN